jgi:hypothetical protein
MPLEFPCSRARAALALASALAATSAGAEPPLSLFGGRVRLAAEVSGTIAPEDEGYFNYSSYESSSLRQFRVDLAAEARLLRFASLVADVRSDNLDAPRVYALYLRLRPWQERELDLQAGLVPTVFGSYPRRRYGYDNPLPSLPLAYQYLTSLREDALPANAEQVVAQRGRGWLVRYPIGSSEAAPGLPLVAGERWDAGVQLRVGREPVSLALALTQGTLCYPQVRDDNEGKQLSGRLEWRPLAGLVAGLSGASGEFVADQAQEALPASASHGPYRQQAAGVDLEWSRGHWIVRGEAVWSRWRLPAVDETHIESPLDALGAYLETRLKLRPGLYLAGRAERLSFSEIATVAGGSEWEARVTRFELGGGFVPARHVLLKASWQHNRRDGGRVRQNDLAALQVLLWY